MADELQALLDRIQTEGLQKAEEERRQLVADATAEAERIRRDARAEADRLLTDARRESDLTVEKGREALKQAARDTVLSLRQQLQARLSAVAQRAASEALDPAASAELIRELVRAFGSSGAEDVDVSVLVGAEQADALARSLEARLTEDLKARPEVKPVPGITGGFKLVFEGQDIVYDFSDEALAEAMCTFLNPRLADLVRPEA